MTKRSLSDRQKGMICIILSAFCFAWMNAFVRLSGDLPFIQKSFFRNLVALLFALAMLLREHGCFLPKKGSLPFLVLRATAGTLGILCNFYAIDHLALSDASILNKMSPFFAILCSWIFLREKLNWKQGLIVLGAFVGALCVIKPTFANADLFPSLIGLLGGFGAGVAYTMVRRLGQIGENKAYIVFFFSAFSCVVTLPYLLFCYEPMTWKQLLCLVMAGLSAAGGQFGVTSAYCYAPAKEISVYDYTQIIFAAGLGFLLAMNTGAGIVPVFSLTRILKANFTAAFCLPFIDETIQLFVEGRSGQISDVWLDMAGIYMGIMITGWLVKIVRTALEKNRKISSGSKWTQQKQEKNNEL